MLKNNAEIKFNDSLFKFNPIEKLFKQQHKPFFLWKAKSTKSRKTSCKSQMFPRGSIGQNGNSLAVGPATEKLNQLLGCLFLSMYYRYWDGNTDQPDLYLQWVLDKLSSVVFLCFWILKYNCYGCKQKFISEIQNVSKLR